MRLYLEHRKAYVLYLQALKAYENIINEYDLLFQRIQPKSALAEHEREFSNETILPPSGARVSKAEEYVIAAEQARISERLQAAKTILRERAEILEYKDKELRRSRDIYNQIYTLKWVDGLKADAIIQCTGYSRSQIYNIIGHITKQLERSDFPGA